MRCHACHGFTPDDPCSACRQNGHELLPSCRVCYDSTLRTKIQSVAVPRVFGVAAVAMFITAATLLVMLWWMFINRVGRESPAPPEQDNKQEKLPQQVRFPVYGYSVVPGGVYSAHQLKAVAEYTGMDESRVKLVLVSRDVKAFATYRMDGRVWWTSHKIRIKHGEFLLTDGLRTVRARCGNELASLPLGPSRPNGPGEKQFDAVVNGRVPRLLTFPFPKESFEVGDQIMVPLPGGAPAEAYGLLFFPPVPFWGGGPGGKPVSMVPEPNSMILLFPSFVLLIIVFHKHVRFKTWEG